MPITARQARIAYEKDQSIGESHKEVVAASKKKTAAKNTPKGEPLMKRVRRKLYEVYHGGNAYMPKKSMETTRTKTVSSGLKQAGLSDKEIAKLRGKK